MEDEVIATCRRVRTNGFERGAASECTAVSRRIQFRGYREGEGARQRAGDLFNLSSAGEGQKSNRCPGREHPINLGSLERRWLSQTTSADLDWKAVRKQGSQSGAQHLVPSYLAYLAWPPTWGASRLVPSYPCRPIVRSTWHLPKLGATGTLLLSSCSSSLDASRIWSFFQSSGAEAYLASLFLLNPHRRKSLSSLQLSPKKSPK